MIPSRLDDNKWKAPKHQKDFYDVYRPNVYREHDIRKHDRANRNYRFLVKTSIISAKKRKACNPILRVQFMATEEHEKKRGGVGNIGTPEKSGSPSQPLSGSSLNR